MSAIKVAIERISLKDTFDVQKEFHDELEAIICYFSDSSREIALISLDLMQLSVSFCNELREQLSRKCSLDVDFIVIHCTHTHTSPSENEFRNSGTEKLVKRLADAIEQARKSAQIASISSAEVETYGKHNVNRRKKISTFDSVFTVWYGYEEYEGRPDGSWQVAKRLEMLTGRNIDAKEYASPILYDDVTDGAINAICFRGQNGQPIGTIVKYSAHPCGAGHVHKRMYSADFPGIVRRVIAKRFGGNACFLTGPCGNIAPWNKGNWGDLALPENGISLSPLWVPHKSDRECWEQVERLGKEIADAISPQIEKAEFRSIKQLNFVNKLIDISIRNDVMDDVDEAICLADNLYNEFIKIRKQSSIAELKQLADKINFLQLHKAFYSEYYYLNRSQCRERKSEIQMPAIRFDDIVMIGFPGEVFHEAQNSVRNYAQKKDLKCFCFTEANGDIGYIPTKNQKINDDYECYCSITARGTLEQLGETSVAIMKELCLS